MARSKFAPGIKKAMPMTTGYEEMAPMVNTFDDSGIIPMDADDVLREQEILGRKFEPEDVDELLLDAAKAWIKAYESNPKSRIDDYLLSVQGSLHMRGDLTAGQAKGVLNCMAAKARFGRKETVRETPSMRGGAIPNGIYTVSLDGTDSNYVTLRVRDDFRDDAPEGSQGFYYLNGPDNESSYKGFAFYTDGYVRMYAKYKEDSRLVDAAAILIGSGDPAAYGRAYARQSGRCYICNRTLTTPESLRDGIGPDCASRM